MMPLPIFKAAAVQASPVFLDLDATVEKACALIREAGRNGAKLIGFPEAFIPGFPSWIFKTGPMGAAAELYARLYQNAVEVPSRAIAQLSQAAQDANIYACVSVTEREGGSLYLSQLWFDPKGDLIGRHRKLRPTGPERYIWGDGDGSTMPVMPSPIGNLGGLLCWEHLVPLTSAAMSAMNEQVHVASWPTAAFVKGGPFDAMADCKIRTGVIKPSAPDISPLEIISRNYAMATQTFVIMATGVLDERAQEIMSSAVPADQFKLGGGSSRIIAPDGSIIGGGLAPDQEGLVYADIPLEMVIYAKYMCDPGGHYSVPNVLSLNFNRASARAMHETASSPQSAPMNYEQLQETVTGAW